MSRESPDSEISTLWNPPQKSGISAFTLIELLTTIAITGVLVALLLAVLSKAKAQGRSIACKNNLSQSGQAMEMSTSDYNIYPSAMGGGGPPFKTWVDQLASYNPLKWTNLSWHCPTYLANGCVVKWQPPPPGGGEFTAMTSYSYNAYGMSGFQSSGNDLLRKGPSLGLGNLNLTVPDHQVVAPSQMYSIAGARPFWQPIVNRVAVNAFAGGEIMTPWRSRFGFGGTRETDAPHSQGYNVLFADAHVDLVKRKDYLYPPRTAQNWNRDNQPHSELWSDPAQWAVQN